MSETTEPTRAPAFVEVRPIKPFTGSYVCGLSEADFIDDALITNSDGVVIKSKVPRKRYRGEIAVERATTQTEFELWKAGGLPKNFEPIGDDGRFVRIHPVQPTIRLPEEIAIEHIARGLCVRAGTKIRPQLGAPGS
ncbi:hypothetical protein [uncultured Hyphomicrobium sp.]|uniref:hypothetical protein n=1 Tax=uncultured Hyphomicrobium sp. TaxID=194373 RepID=UPI0025E4E15E|nr:hypothetical protein [uncultured Hyphomicrobium sp.]